MGDETPGAWAKLTDWMGRAAWPGFLKGARGLTWFTGLVAALSALVLWFPQAYAVIAWQQVDYAVVTSLHAGDNSDYVTSKLGLPAITKSFAEHPDVVEDVYLRRDNIVETLVDSAKQVLLYSVLSCSPDYQPVFDTPLGSQVHLQSRPLAIAEDYAPSNAGPTGSAPTAADVEMLNARTLTYLPQYTGSSLNQFIETGIASGSEAGRDQSWFVGVNGVCAAPNQLSDPSLIGSLSLTTPAVIAFRTSTAANFYAETTSNAQLSLDPDGDLHFAGVDEPDGETGIFVTPFTFDLPAALYNPAGTRTFG